ncbi:ricin-type beta-trefoil lectin domain protein [Streptomyces sp. NPDC087658]|uniref:ricin-type beta-trefoil lectin domain protein n=1 Tax=Streptomyces sp. NPDC087658 TaxID=3365800 RepID=UPI0037F2EE88
MAHPDDDLLFVNPEIYDTIRAGCSLSTVYFTAGDAGERDLRKSRNYVENRENGVRRAYAEMAGVADRWNSDDVYAAERRIRSFTLSGKLPGRKKGQEVRLVFLGLRDGMPHGSRKGSLLRLFDGNEKEIAPLRGGRGYDEERLLKTLTVLVGIAGAERILTLDHDNASFAYGEHGRVDHSDHGMTARYVRKAAYLAGVPLESYLGYTMTPLEENLTPAGKGHKERIFRWYATQRLCPRVRVCEDTHLYKGKLPEIYAQWILRQYPQKYRIPGPGEIMGDIGRTTFFGDRNPEQCLGVEGSASGAGAVGIFGCDGSDAQRWDAGKDGTIRNRLDGEHCLAAAGDRVEIQECRGARAEQKWHRMPWRNGTWKRAAWKIAGHRSKCLYQHDRTFPRWKRDERKYPRLGLVSCDRPDQPELYWQWNF